MRDAPAVSRLHYTHIPLVMAAVDELQAAATDYGRLLARDTASPRSLGVARRIVLARRQAVADLLSVWEDPGWADVPLFDLDGDD